MEPSPVLGRTARPASHRLELPVRATRDEIGVKPWRIWIWHRRSESGVDPRDHRGKPGKVLTPGSKVSVKLG